MSGKQAAPGKGTIMAKWTGWWEQRVIGRRTMHDLVLDVAAGGAVTGSGEECVGPFTFEGRFQPDGTISLVKQYIGVIGSSTRPEFRGRHFWHLGHPGIWYGPVRPSPHGGRRRRLRRDSRVGPAGWD